ncbi:MAG: hypothetical protein AAF752_01210 [Bacteroidota bacterium]
MSIIVAVRKGSETVVAADGLISFGTRRVPAGNIRCEKLYRTGDAVLGVAGWSLYDDIVRDYLAGFDEPPALGSKAEVFQFFQLFWGALHERYPFVKDQPDDADSPFGDIDSSFLVAHPNGLFFVSSDLSVTEFTQYYAIGSGTDFALGALHALYRQDSLDAEALALQAIDASIAYDVHCGGPVSFERVG